ncbi:MAG: OsmC family protein [Promethearchaeota archaeon]
MNSEGNELEIEIYWKEKMKFLTLIRDFEPFLMDDKKKGDDSAPSPVEMFLGSIGSCLAMSFIYCTYLTGIQLNIEEFKVKIIGKLGRINNRLRLIKVNAEFTLKSDKNITKIRKCFNKFQPFCILSESIKVGIPFECNLKVLNE